MYLNHDSVSSSAPGKVILFGEHAVVYPGIPAIAACVTDLRIYVTMTPIFQTTTSTTTTQQQSTSSSRGISDSTTATRTTTMASGTTKDLPSATKMEEDEISHVDCHTYICIHMPDLVRSNGNNNDNDANSSSVASSTSTNTTMYIPFDTIVNNPSLQLSIPPTIECSKQLETMIRTTHCCNTAKQDTVIPTTATSGPTTTILLPYDDLFIQAVIPLLYLVHILLRQPEQQHHQQEDSRSTNHVSLKGLHIHVQSNQLPIGAGLGSSAAFSVASTASLLQIRQKVILQQQQYKINNKNNNNQETTEITTTTTTTETSIGTEFTTSCSPYVPTKDVLDEINRISYYSEILLHGTPSGIDNAVSTYGGAILFTKQYTTEQQQQQQQHEQHQQELGKTISSSSVSNESTTPSVITIPAQMKHIPMNKTIRDQDMNGDSLLVSSSSSWWDGPREILLVNTNVPRSTKQLVGTVRILYEQYPDIITPILQAMGHIAQTFYDSTIIINNNNTNVNEKDPKKEEIMNHNSQYQQQQQQQPISIIKLVQMNQLLLRLIDVSHCSIDYICEVVNDISNKKKNCCTSKTNGATTTVQQAAAKLTGAGGGGCVLIVFDDDTTTSSSGITTAAEGSAASVSKDEGCSSNSSSSHKVDDHSKKIRRSLQNEIMETLNSCTSWNYEYYWSQLGGDGVTFHLPPPYHCDDTFLQQKKKKNQKRRQEQEQQKQKQNSITTQKRDVDDTNTIRFFSVQSFFLRFHETAQRFWFDSSFHIKTILTLTVVASSTALFLYTQHGSQQQQQKITTNRM